MVRRSLALESKPTARAKGVTRPISSGATTASRAWRAGGGAATGLPSVNSIIAARRAAAPQKIEKTHALEGRGWFPPMTRGRPKKREAILARELGGRAGAMTRSMPY